MGSEQRKDVNVKVFNIITRINEVKTLVRHISCGCEIHVLVNSININASVKSIVQKSL